LKKRVMENSIGEVVIEINYALFDDQGRDMNQEVTSVNSLFVH